MKTYQEKIQEEYKQQWLNKTKEEYNEVEASRKGLTLLLLAFVVVMAIGGFTYPY